MKPAHLTPLRPPTHDERTAARERMKALYERLRAAHSAPLRDLGDELRDLYEDIFDRSGGRPTDVDVDTELTKILKSL